MPNPGFGVAAAAVGSQVYCFGGMTGDPRHPAIRNAGDVYDAVRDSWTTGLPVLPRPRAYSGCAAFEGKIYVLGGSDGQYEYRRCDRFDPATRQWDTIASLPWSVEVPGACSYGGSLYLIGGYTMCSGGNYLRRVLKFVPDSGAGVWIQVDSMNELRASMGVAVANGRMYAVGGRFYNSLATSEYFDGDTWTTVTRRMSGPRGGLAAVACDSALICVMGGSYRAAALNVVEVLDTRTENWLVVEPLLSARYYLSAALAAGKLVAIGGRDAYVTLGAVETHAAWFPGIEEEPNQAVRRTLVPALVRARLQTPAGPGTGWQLLDEAGRTVGTGSGAAELKIEPGVYFYRQQDQPGSNRVTVVR